MHPNDMAFIDKYIRLLCDSDNTEDSVFCLIKQEGR